LSMAFLRRAFGKALLFGHGKERNIEKKPDGIYRDGPSI
jgi:hypothetical protein